MTTTIFSIQRLTIARQRYVGEQVLPTLEAEVAPRRKRSEVIVRRVGEFTTAHRMLMGVTLVPKLTVDNAADRAYSGAFNTLQGVVQTFANPIVPIEGEAQTRLHAASTLLTLAFPAGVGFIRKPMNLQYDAMRGVVRALRGEAANDHVEALGFTSTVDFLEALLSPYGVAATSPDGVDLERLSDAWHQSFAKLAAAIVGVLPDGDKLHEVVALYQKEAEAQSAAEADARRRAKKAKAAKKVA